MSPEPELRRAFIVGCRRSGTTWTMLLSAQHPQAVALQQTDVMRRLLQLTSWFEEGHRYGRCVLTPKARDGHEPAPNGLTRIGLEELLDRGRLSDLAREFADEIFALARRTNPEARVVVEQTPEHLGAADGILRVYPDACFVHVIRDPRAVFASHRGAARSWARPSFFSSDPIRVAEEWCREVGEGREIAGKTERYLELRYERLKDDPDAELQRLHAFLGLASDAELRQRAIEACGIDRLRAAHLAPTGFFRRGEAEGWREELSSSEVRTIEHICGPLMDELGYRRVTGGRAPLRLRLRWLRSSAAERMRRVAAHGGLSGEALGLAARVSPTLRRALRARN